VLEFLGMVEQFSRPEERYIDERYIRFLREQPATRKQFHIRHLLWAMLMTGIFSGTAKLIADEIRRDAEENHRITAKESGYLPA